MAEPHGQATFYQYRLIKKIQVSKPVFIPYLILPLIAAAAGIWTLSPYILFYFLIAFPIILWIQYVIGHTVLLLLGPDYRKRWRFRIKLPWLGYTPEQHISRRIFSKVHVYTGLVGLSLWVIMALWLPIPFTASLVFWHVWLLLPRFTILMRFASLPKDGMIKLSDQDIAYYRQ